MILKASLFRLSNFNYKKATRAKLNLFINIVIFISIFALSASILSMYYENRIDDLDRKKILLDFKKVILENQITNVPVSLGVMDTINDINTLNKSNYELLKELKIEDIETQFASERQNYFREYFDAITYAFISTTEINNLIQNNKLIFEEDKLTLDQISNFEKQNKDHENRIYELDEQKNKIKKKWEEYEAMNLTEEYGVIGIEFIQNNNGAEIVQIEKFSPADNSDLEIGDIIVSVNQILLSNLTLDEISQKLTFPPNKEITLEIKNKGKIGIITNEVWNEDLTISKDTRYYLKFKNLRDEVFKILDEQRDIYLKLGLDLTVKNLDKINENLKQINFEIKTLSKKEADTILFAFVIQLLIFLSTQYFEFSIGQTNEKKKVIK